MSKYKCSFYVLLPRLKGVADPRQGVGLDAGEPDPPPPQPRDQRKRVNSCDFI